MSILIQGMEMPDGDDAKIIAILPTGEVFSIYLDNESGELGFCRMSNNAVTAVSVPPHGRLIDADKYEFPGDLIDEPTIIPAEEET